MQKSHLHIAVFEKNLTFKVSLFFIMLLKVVDSFIFYEDGLSIIAESINMTLSIEDVKVSKAGLQSNFLPIGIYYQLATLR